MKATKSKKVKQLKVKPAEPPLLDVCQDASKFNWAMVIWVCGIIMLGWALVAWLISMEKSIEASATSEQSVITLPLKEAA